MSKICLYVVVIKILSFFCFISAYAQKLNIENMIFFPKDTVITEYVGQTEKGTFSIVLDADSEISIKEFESIYLPFGEGKYIPSDDIDWLAFLKKYSPMEAGESLSMPFISVNKEGSSYLLIFETPFDTYIRFDGENLLNITIKRERISIKKDNSLKILLIQTDNNPFKVAEAYKNYLIRNNNYTTIPDKIKINGNVEKLYGAAHIYLYDMTVISENDINWKNFIININEISSWIISKDKSSNKSEVLKAFEEIKLNNYVDNYKKYLIINYLSDLIYENLNAHKYEFYQKFPTVCINTPDKWAYDRSVYIIDELHKNNIKNLWIGLSSWEQAFIIPELIDKSIKYGYLIAPYDSYHSIHKPGSERWITAKFDSPELYDNTSIVNKNGRYVAGFKGVGRKLNSSLIMGVVTSRIESILKKSKFNSWFIDCDATGEVYNDYSKNHITTKEDDASARQKRLSLISNKYKLVTGSEGGNQFFVNFIAFAHGVMLPNFSWFDEDMNNKSSSYFVGKYYNINGGAPEIRIKQVPLKPSLYKIYLNPAYSVPLYKIVFNNALFAIYHWDYGTLKFKDYIKQRELFEIIYNVPPMYHLDKFEWVKQKNAVLNHIKEWSDISKTLIGKDITEFHFPDNNRLVHIVKYEGLGETVWLIGNFSDKPYAYNGNIIKPMGYYMEKNAEK